MRLFITAGLSSLLFYSPCMAFDQDKETPSAKARHRMRIESFAKQLSSTVMDIPQQILPMVKALDEEVSAELRSDWPKIRDELRSQMSHLSPWKRDRQGK